MPRIKWSLQSYQHLQDTFATSVADYREGLLGGLIGCHSVT